MEPIIPQNHIPPTPSEPVVPEPQPSEGVRDGVSDGAVEAKAPAREEVPHRAHTYQDDLAKAMDATDATVVQELLATAREREAFETDEKGKNRQRSFYTVGSILFVILALGAIGYGAWHFRALTVPVEQTLSVGVFSNTDLIIAETTDVEQVVQSFLNGGTVFPEGKPHLISLVHNTQPPVLLSNAELFSFIGAKPTEPFATSIDMIRWGVVNIGTETVPFIIASMPDAEKATKEFLIAETNMLTMFYKALSIDSTQFAPDANLHFTSTYMYNLPVRVMQHTTLEGGVVPIMLYGSATNHIVVITTKPAALQVVYDTVIKQYQ